MRCPTLSELPPPPEGKTGWPWTEESDQLPGTVPDGSPWPRISIVTPSYNQGLYIEETIRSVLLQGYPNLEYIIMDGGSTDETVDIIQKYELWLTHWVSAPDGGQVRAINAGLNHSSGEILNWLNSDDYLLQGALFIVAAGFRMHSGVDIFIGSNKNVWRTANNQKFETSITPDLNRPWVYRYGIAGVPQDASFFSKRVWEMVGPLDFSLDYVFDTKLYADLLLISEWIVVSNVLISVMNRHTSQKTYRNYHAENPERDSGARWSIDHNQWMRRFLQSRFGEYIAVFPCLKSKRKNHVLHFKIGMLKEWVTFI